MLRHLMRVSTVGLAIAIGAPLAAETPDLPEGEVTVEAVMARHGLTRDEVERLIGHRGLEARHLLVLETMKLKRTLFKMDHPRPDNPYGAAEFRLLQQAGEAGEPVRPNALGEAIAATDALRAEIRVRGLSPDIARDFAPEETGEARALTTVAGIPVGEVASLGAEGTSTAGQRDARAGMVDLQLETLKPYDPDAVVPTPENIGPAAWKWLGPANVGGRTRAIVIHPDEPRVMWAGAVAGGVWKSLDGGQNWAPLGGISANLNVSTMIMHPTDPDRLLAGTGEGYYGSGSFRGAGIFYSRDGGASWDQLPATATEDFHFVNRLDFTADGSALVVATRTGVFRSTDYDTAFVERITFTKSQTEDLGEVLDIDCHPTDPRLCVAGGRQNRAYVSRDGGVSWRLSAGIPAPAPGGSWIAGRVELTYALGDPRVVYASVDRNQGEIWRSEDGGESFSRASTGTQFLSGQGWYNNVIWAGDPTRPDLVVVGGIDNWRSTDGGRTLERISDWRWDPLSAHADNHAIISHPNYNGRTNRIVYFGNDGGVYANTDILFTNTLSGWKSLNNGYGVTQFYGAGGNAFTGRIVAGTQDNGTQVYVPDLGPAGYQAMFGGDGGASAADPDDPNVMYGEYVFLQIHRSVDGGQRASFIHDGIDDAGRADGALFIAPFILDPADPETLLAGGRSLWRSTNVRASSPFWSAIKPPLDRRRAYISTIAAAPSAEGADGSDILWVGHSSGEVFVSRDGRAEAPQWQRVDGQLGQELPDRIVNRLRIDPHDHDTVYAMFGGFRAGNIWKTTDGGATWSDISGRLPQVSIYDVAVHPGDPSQLYLANEIGVFASADGGRSWWPTNQGPTNVPVFELFWMGPRLVAVTHGRGIFWIDLAGSVAAAGAAFEMPDGMRRHILPVSRFNAR